MTILEFLSQPLWQRFGLTLLHFLWQGLAVGLFVAALVRVFRVKQGNARYAAYLLAFTAMIVCPILTFSVIDIPLGTQPTVAITPEPAEAIESPIYSVSPTVGDLPEITTPLPIASEAEPGAVVVSISLGQKISDWLDVSMPWALVRR